MISPTPSIDLTPMITVTPTATSTPAPTIFVPSPTLTPSLSGNLSTLFWAVLILLGAALLGIFGFLMGQSSNKAE